MCLPLCLSQAQAEAEAQAAQDSEREEALKERGAALEAQLATARESAAAAAATTGGRAAALEEELAVARDQLETLQLAMASMQSQGRAAEAQLDEAAANSQQVRATAFCSERERLFELVPETGRAVRWCVFLD